MSDKSQNDTCSGGFEMDDVDSQAVGVIKCVKLKLDKHISAYLKTKREKSESVLDGEHSNIICSTLIEKVFLNYIIAKQILGNLSWQDKLLCQQVCRIWHFAVKSLREEQLWPEDFMLDVRFRSLKYRVEFKQSDYFLNEPLVVMTYSNAAAFGLTCECKFIQPHPCGSNPCDKEHSLLDVIHKYSSAPKDCINMLKCEYISYMPLSQSETFKYTIKQMKTTPLMAGLYIPAIPDVKYHMLNLKSYNSMKLDYIDFVDNMTKDRIVKGLVIYVTDKYLLHPVEDIVFIRYLQDVQPDHPYALGGCIIEDTISEQSNLSGLVEGANNDKSFVSDNLMSMGFFTVPKSAAYNKYNFSMYSLVIESFDKSKTNIQETINEFAKRVPQFEYSVALKLSCIGRDQKHTWEQNCFRAAFPNTRIIGCYGNGELGVDYPEKPERPRRYKAKRPRVVDSDQYDIIYSYSTVFVYFGWGKITSSKGPN